MAYTVAAPEYEFGTAGGRRKLGILGEHCATIDRDPSEIEISVMGRTADRDEMYEIGARIFTVHVGGPSPDRTELREFSPDATSATPDQRAAPAIHHLPSFQ
ncbi:hypothetical protein [Actinoplanes xinjiangensis]|uniref:hypothetical protein n=1 Tax=Actinoplanes xinjiangensis TaxID=512350 RepID=UPI001942B87D|nr:hypothetical protein [Actinoplanes xinjiangensis]